MSWLKNFKVISKILVVIVQLSIVAIGLSWLSIRSMSAMNEDAEIMASAAKRALEAARANTNVIALNSAEFQVALDPRPESRLEIRNIVDRQLKQLSERFEDFSKTRDEGVKSLLPSLKDSLGAYRESVENTIKLASQVKDITLSDQTEHLRAAAMNSRALAEKLRSSMRDVAERLDGRVDQSAKAAAEQYQATSRLLMTIAAVGIILGIIVGFLIGQFGIAKPIVLLKGVMEAFARNDLSADVPGKERRDEVGDMARTVQVFKNNAIEIERLRADQEAAEKRAAAQRKAELNKLADAFEAAVGQIIETVSSASTELESSAGTLTATAVSSQERTTMVASASEEASTNVQSVASATEELASSVNEISRQVQESARIATEAVEQARKTNDRVGELENAASKIGSVVQLINNIAEQTNLLALNATIEAARAGEAGRGFAVVASEVKALAEQTAKATGDISQQITGMQAVTHESVAAIKEIGGTVERISEISAAIASAVEEQGAATQEISRNVQQAAQGAQLVSSNIVEVQHGANETGSASSQVLSAAKSLSRDSNRLKLEVDKFMNTVRAA